MNDLQPVIDSKVISHHLTRENYFTIWFNTNRFKLCNVQGCDYSHPIKGYSSNIDVISQSWFSVANHGYCSIMKLQGLRMCSH